MIKSHDNEFAARWPTIRNCNFSTRDDVRGQHIWEAIVNVFELGCDDADLLATLDDLEAVLVEHAESDSETSEKACTEAEESVEGEYLSMRITAGRWSRSR
jgi:hypothetical protein